MSIAIVDFSWLLHRYKNSLKDLSCTRNGETIPTGHVYGTLKFVSELASKYSRVVLCVDSHNTKRKALFSGYKSNRHKPTGNWQFDYNVHLDVPNILAMLSIFPNVFYAEVEGYEADDLVAYFIRKSNNWDFYFRDNDILQTKGAYRLMVSFSQPLVVGNEVDRKAHISEKFGIDKDWLPLLWKVVKGDAGDCIPIGLERFPSKDLSAICNQVEDDQISFADLKALLLGHEYSGKWKEAIKALDDPSSDWSEKLELNYNLVKPMLPEVVHLNRSECKDAKALMQSYSIQPAAFL